MIVIYMSEEPEHEGFIGLAKHKIGDKIRVVKITLTEGDLPDTRQIFLDALGKSFEVKEINLWESSNPGAQWEITYEVQPTKHDSIFLNNDEVVAEKSSL